MDGVRLVLVGGFLGAGKTTLLTQAAARLVAAGKRVGVITNDQAEQLVDTATLAATGVAVHEVAGGCFCCRFDDLVAGCGRLVAAVRPDVVLAEPVGSCTDLSATVVQPLKQFHATRFRVAPFSVLADPARLRAALDGGAGALPEGPRYIFRKQLEEADLIVLNKTDRLSADELADLERRVAAHFPGTPVLAMSALTGVGVDAWLDLALRGGPAGRRVADVDYDIYAAGEAALGWLNATLRLSAEGGADWEALCLDLLRHLRDRCHARSAEIAHVKLLATAPSGRLTANLTANDAEPQARGAIAGRPEAVSLVLNARVHTDPDALRALVQDALQAAAGERVRVFIASIAHFSPARPQPTHRLAAPAP